MGTPIKPENTNQDGDQGNKQTNSDQNQNQNSNQNQGNTQQGIQSTNNAPPQQNFDIVRVVLSEYEQKNRELMDELKRERERNNRPPEIPKEQQTKEYFEDPVRVQRQLIKETVEEQLKPIKDAILGFKSASAYETLKAQFKPTLPPHIQSHWAAIEPYVDKLMTNVEPTVQNIRFAVSTTVGELLSNGYNFVVPGNSNVNNNNISSNPPTNTSNSNMNSPHVRPSTPAAPITNNNASDGDYGEPSENERRLMREYGFKTYKEYRDAIGAPVNNPLKLETKTNMGGR